MSTRIAEGNRHRWLLLGVLLLLFTVAQYLQAGLGRSPAQSGLVLSLGCRGSRA